MARKKELKVVVNFVNTDLVINDVYPKVPRYELYNTVEKKVIKKSNNPMDFDQIVKILGRNNNSQQVPEEKKIANKSD